jgi:general secretion pathway protein A
VEHLHHFKLAEDPFRNEPLLRYLFESRQQQEVLRRMDRAVRQAKGLCVLIGDVGSGKTMAVRQLFESLEEEVFEASMMVVLNGAADSTWMMTRFAKQLGIEEPAPEREALIAEIYERLAIVREDGRHAVLIIDDAEALASPETLAEICGLLKLEYEDRRLLSLVLSGTPLLEEALASTPILEHRVDVKVHLKPLESETAAAYLAHRVRGAGGDPAILEPEAVRALHAYGRGIPGLMNTLADNALFEAFLCGRGSVTAKDVERAHRDLGWDLPVAPAAPMPAAAPTAPLPAAAPAAFAAPESPRAAAPFAAPASPRPIPEDPSRPSLEDLDSELEAVFEPTPAAPATHAPVHPTSPEVTASYASERPPPFVPREGPPKEEPEPPEDLLVELLDD